MGDAGDEWEFQRIGTESEKSSVEKELAELRERLQKVEEWKKRRGEIEEELNRVWTQDEGELEAPEYLEGSDEVGSGEEAVESRSGSGSGSDEVDRSEE
jgi:ATP-binding cassette subfamily D (ALD) long-chain fatty acid import protein